MTCQVYHDAPALVKQGERTMSTDELTGVQALERKHPGLPLAPGHVQRREFEYERHGTRAFILSRDVVTGKLLAPFCGPTRKEDDFLAHVQAVVATDRQQSPAGILSVITSTSINPNPWCASWPRSQASRRIWARKANMASWP